MPILSYSLLLRFVPVKKKYDKNNIKTKIISKFKIKLVLKYDEPFQEKISE